MPLEQNFPLKDAVKNITYAFGYVLFLWSIGVQNRFKVTFWTFSAVLLVLAILAAKPGSGVHLLLPLLPLAVWLGAETYVQLSEDDRRRYSLRIAAFLLSLSLNGLNRQKIEAYYLSETPMRWREFADLKELTRNVEGPLEMGYGETEKYYSSFYKPWLVHHGHGLFLDAAAIMETDYTGVPLSRATIEKVTSCVVPHIVLPKNAKPWALENFYHHRDLFPKELQEQLIHHYQLERTSEFYDLFACH